MFETNELNALNGKIMRITQQSTEINQKEEEKRRNKLKELPNLKITKLQSQVDNLFKEILQLQTGQILDDVRGNAQLLSGISQIRYIVQAICVKLILSDPNALISKNGQGNLMNTDNCYVCTFRIYPSTMFSEIKKAACEFWNKIEQKYSLTDEYYNNLVTYNDSVMNFFKNYNALNPSQDAVVYLVKANQKSRELNRLQMDCITLDDKKNKMKENEQGGNLSKFRRRTLDFNKIEKVLPGLAQYREPTEEQVKKYMKNSDPLSFQNNIWIFLMYILIFILTWVSLELKSQSREVYAMSKVLETWLQAQYTGDIYNNTNDIYSFQRANFDEKYDLFKYLQNDFSKIFLHNPDTPSQLHTVHTQRVNCQGGGTFLKCYAIQANEGTINKTSIGVESWEKYRSYSDVNESLSIKGEFTTINGNGFTLDVDPQISPKDFNTLIEKSQKTFFSNAARGVLISFTTYSVRTDWWAYNYVLHEYGAHDVLIPPLVRSFPFKPNLYESQDEKRIYYLDIFRLTITLIIFTGVIIFKNGFRFANLFYYMIFFQCLSLLLIGLLIIKFNRVSRRLSQLYNMIEKPLFTLFMLMIMLVIIYSLLGYCAEQIWGVDFYEFRSINTAYYSMFSMFSLHSNQILPKVEKLYINREFWSFVFIIIYIVFMQYTFMNVFTSIFFEEQRVVSMYEEAIYKKYENLRRKKIVKQWLSGIFMCCTYCKSKAKQIKKLKKKDDNLEAVNVLREKMKQQKQNKQKAMNNRI
ncbi:UNKNOWN [Stylonychia lemnae]|uniref:Uncharacterized protein n=1 Tax=Stylonychia lemnae TaxID=5949 RepID=A0A078A2M4_STYLE|nr:UNKNOWN [Stylonychia lemnae]|eukprot:CDW75034.1 UNKNOWN [Stylonychia lemnae]